MNNTFNQIVGQSALKNRLMFYLEGFKLTNMVPTLALHAARGYGKTEVARTFLKALKKPAFEINASTIKNVKQFMDFWFNHGMDKEISILIDEYHELNSDIFNMLLTALNPNRHNRNTVKYDDVNVVFDLKKCTMIFATTEKNRIPIPFLDRLTEITFDEYTNDDLASIIQKNVSLVPITSGAARTLANFSRGNGRSAAKIGNEVERFAQIYNIDKFDIIHTPSIIKTLDLLPLGLFRNELNLLKTIAERKSTTLTMLASKTGMTKSSQSELESYLLKHNLIEIDNGRKITKKGKDYLFNLGEQYV